MRRVGRSTTTERGYFRGLLDKHSSFVPPWWNRPDPRSRRHAPGLAARPGQRAEALSDPRFRYSLGLLMRFADRGGDAPGVHRDGFRPDSYGIATRWQPHRHDIARRRQSARRIRRHDQTDPTRLITQFLNGLIDLGRLDARRQLLSHRGPACGTGRSASPHPSKTVVINASVEPPLSTADRLQSDRQIHWPARSSANPPTSLR
jgi:hypothetical protein